MINTEAISTENFFKNAVSIIAIDEPRKEILKNISQEITKIYKINNTVNLNFICTHNSRRSQLGQVWSFFASTYFNLNIDSFSGGTEVTAFHANTIKTLQKAGFNFELKVISHENPQYKISFKDSSKSILGFSKLYDDAVNPTPFIAITTCDSADKNCPFIPEASAKFHLPFVDPKGSDNSENTEKTYLETNNQIAAEINFIFSEVKNSLT